MSATHDHGKQKVTGVRCGVITVSDTRSPADDASGDAIVSLLSDHGHQVVCRAIVPDVPERISSKIREAMERHGTEALLLTGGTGIAPRDTTPETLEGIYDRPLPGFGELFRMLSWEEVGAAAMLSRASAGIVDRCCVFSMPGSTPAVTLAMRKLVIPQLGHAAWLLGHQNH